MRRTALVATLTALALSGVAAAVITIYDQQANGTASGSFGQHTVHMDAITFATGTGTSTPVVPCTAGSGASCTGGTPGVIPVAITNNDPNVAHAAISPTVTLSTTLGGCTAHLFVTGTSNLTETVTAGATEQNGSVAFVADPGTPISCDGAAITATIAATTT